MIIYKIVEYCVCVVFFFVVKKCSVYFVSSYFEVVYMLHDFVCLLKACQRV